MRIRQPKFDFSRARAHWSPNWEFAQLQNSASLGIPPLERFLNRVMVKARKEITGDDPISVNLRRDMMTFIKQESCHTVAHEQMNAVLVRDGYDRIPEFERVIEAHYARLLSTKSLAFLAAYCEGFETLGPASAMAWCGDALDDLLVGADPNVEMMFRWHLLEEFEHRHVCFDVFKRLHGGYFLRVYAFCYQAYHFARLARMVKVYLFTKDRETMTPDDISASKQREKAIGKTMRKNIARHLLKVFLPSYRPHTLPVPKSWFKLEAEIEAGWLRQIPEVTTV